MQLTQRQVDYIVAQLNKFLSYLRYADCDLQEQELEIGHIEESLEIFKQDHSWPRLIRNLDVFDSRDRCMWFVFELDPVAAAQADMSVAMLLSAGERYQ